MKQEFTSSMAWNAERPRVLVVCCSDGRFHAPIMDFVDHEVSDRADLIALPGGAAVIDPWTSSFDEARVFDASFALLERHHDLHEVWLIAHEGCSYYKLKHPVLAAAELESRQLADLRGASRILRERSPQLEVRAVFARIHDERVVFAAVVGAGGWAPDVDASSVVA